MNRRTGIFGSLILGSTVLLAGASGASSNLTPRVAALESQVAALTTRVAALEAAPSPTPTATSATPTPAPSAPSSWQLIWSDDFDTWDPTRYYLYGDTADGTAGYRDTQEQRQAGTGGIYSSANITASGGQLHVRLFTDSTGVPRVAAFIPQLPSTTNRGDRSSMVVEFRVRADRMVGYKGVPLLWPIAGNPWPEWGEINWPESSFDQRPSAFMHRQGATSGSDQDFYPAPTGTSWQDPHVYRIEWIAGQSAAFLIDGAQIGKSTSRVPAGPMHLVMQWETEIGGSRPDPSVSGQVDIDYLRIWSLEP